MALLGTCALAGCKILTVDADRALRAQRAADFDATRYVDLIWASKVLPTIKAEARSAPAVIAAMDGGMAKADTLGRRVGEGSAWTFVISGDGVVTGTDLQSPHGGFDVALPGASGRSLRIQTGPVVSDTAIRDALPFVNFNDFTDQLAFADVGRALTARSLDGLRPALAQVRTGRRVHFTGVANVRDAGDPLVLTPISLVVSDAS